MLKKTFPVIEFAILVVTSFLTAADVTGAASAPTVALTGQVSSQEEGRMEGVLVSAKRDGSTVTITVVSDGQGHFSFPAAKLEPGRYAIAIRAAGYDLDGSKPAE